jgi:hypothetical protein
MLIQIRVTKNTGHLFIISCSTTVLVRWIEAVEVLIRRDGDLENNNIRLGRTGLLHACLNFYQVVELPKVCHRFTGLTQGQRQRMRQIQS